MTRETKVGLLVGMGIILLIGIVVSDHLSKVQQQQPANFTDLGRATFDSLTTRQNHALPTGVPIANSAHQAHQQRNSPIPLVNEVIQPTQQRTFFEQAPPAPNYQQQPQTIAPSQRPNAQPPIRLRQPRRVQDMSEEQAVAQNTRTRPIPHMASALDPRPRTLATSGTQRTVSGIQHLVKRGENLSDIAYKYYNDGNDWRIIRDANPQLITRNGTIIQGSKILIPNKQVLKKQQNNLATMVRSTQREIIVKPGQTLSGLAQKHLGNSSDWDELLKANRDKISRPEQLRAGMTLRLPAKDISATRQTPQVTNRQTAPPVTTTKTYTIKPGDTLSGIAAQKLGQANKWRKLYKYNKSAISDPNNLTVGAKIKIPG